MITAIADDVVIHYNGRFIVKQVMAPLDAITKSHTVHMQCGSSSAISYV